MGDAEHHEAVAGSFQVETPAGIVTVAPRAEVERLEAWPRALRTSRKDARYYGIVEDTLGGDFEYGYLVVRSTDGRVRAVQPFFITEQDVVAAAVVLVRAFVAFLRRLFPRLGMLRTLMVGCAAGEGHLDEPDGRTSGWLAQCLHEALPEVARRLDAQLVVLKEFPQSYRETLSCFSENGYARVPSYPMTRLFIGYESFDDYMAEALGPSTRKSLRRKFRRAAAAGLQMTVEPDAERVIDEIYPLYLQVYERSSLHLEKLTPEFLVRLCRDLSESVRLFVWRLDGRAVAFSLCMLEGQVLYDEYLGLDYTVALELSLWFWTFKQIVEWGMKHGYSWYCSTALGYDPKLHLRCDLAPLDLYVMHLSRARNWLLHRTLPLLAPALHDRSLTRFANSAALRS